MVTDIDIQVPILIDIDRSRTCRPLVGVGGRRVALVLVKWRTICQAHWRQAPQQEKSGF